MTTTEIIYTNDHETITWELIQMVEHNEELKLLLIKSIDQAKKKNPNKDSNPVDSLESYYNYIDYTLKALPWRVNPSKEFSGLYDQINQGMGCAYFINNQPLEELKDKHYFHNSIMYHEPYRSWFIRYVSEYGMFLNTEESWKEEYLRIAKENFDFHLGDDTYEDPSNWKCFNDFFARKLKDPSKRPIDEVEDDLVIVSPADAVPQGVWKIDEHHRISSKYEEVKGIAIKTGTLTDVSVLLEKSKYAKSFANGMLTHTFLDINDYHRYHFPVSGTIEEVFPVYGDDAPGGVIVWEESLNRYKQYYSDVYGWQAIETRGVVTMRTDGGSLIAIVPVGMCQVSSVNFEETVIPGAKVKKGDPLGYFLFGGSDIVMIFSQEAQFEFLTVPNVPIPMGRIYGKIQK